MQANPVPQSPAPNPVAGRQPVLVTTQGTTIPLPTTRADIAAIRERRSELSDQLTSAAGRRENLVKELAGITDPVGRAGLEQRIQVLDTRIVQLERDIAETGRLLTSAPTVAFSTSVGPAWAGGLSPGQTTFLSGLAIVFVLAPLAFAAARLMWRRAFSPRDQSAHQADTTQRLDRLEKAIDTIAFEIERVSEGQRFVTRLMTEGHEMPRLGAAGAAEPVRQSREDAVRIPRERG